MTTKPTSFTKSNLDNGITLMHEKQTTPPVVAIRIFIPGGSALEAEGQEGLTHLTARMLTRQTANRDMYEFSRFVDDNGLKINSSISNDYTRLSLTGVSEFRKTLLKATREILTEPGFDPDALERLRRQQLANIRQRRDQAFSYAIDEARSTFYGDHPYNHHKLGLEETVESFTARDCQNFYENQIQNKPVILSVVGDIEEDEVHSLFSDMGAYDSDESSVSPVPETNGGREFRTKDVDQPTHILVYEAPEISRDEYVSAKVLDSLLGGGMSSILFNEMREERSLGYQVGSSFPSRRFTSSFSVYLGGDAESNGETFRTVFQEIVENLIEEGPTEEQLSKAKEYLKGNFLLEHETPGKRAWYRGFYEVLGREADFDQRYPGLIDEITKENIQDICEKMFGLESPLFLTVEPPK